MKWFTTVLGFTFGLALAILAGLTAGFGHGLYAPLALVSSPISMIGIRSGLITAPLLWGLVGLLLKPERRKPRCFVVAAILLLSYFVAAVLLHSPSSSFADCDQWSQVPEKIKVLAVSTATLWFVGQTVIWIRIASTIYGKR